MHTSDAVTLLKQKGVHPTPVQVALLENAVIAHKRLNTLIAFNGNSFLLYVVFAGFSV
jgi:hypothetical protein